MYPASYGISMEVADFFQKMLIFKYKENAKQYKKFKNGDIFSASYAMYN